MQTDQGLTKQSDCIAVANTQADLCVKMVPRSVIPCDAMQFLVYQYCLKNGINRDGRR
jgi:hypothetical protein